jgi:hypothetical protein
MARIASLDSSFFSWSAAVMGNRCAIFNRLDIQTSRLERCNRTFSSTARSFDANVDLFDAELKCLVGCLLGGTLTGKRRAFSTSFETAGSRTGPTKRFAFGVSDGHGCVVKSRFDVGHAHGYVATSLTTFRLGHRLMYSLNLPVDWARIADASTAAPLGEVFVP